MFSVTINLMLLSAVMLIVVVLGVGVQAIQILRSFEQQIFRQCSQMEKSKVFGQVQMFFNSSTFQSPLNFVPFHLVNEQNYLFKVDIAAT
jgi:hypothetical protein